MILGYSVVVLICIFWIICTILKQINKDRFKRDIDPFALIPIWTLFSPRPMKNNYLLGYRNLYGDNSASEIILINNFTPKWFYTFWYGQRRDIKFILGLRKQMLRSNPNLFSYSPSLLLIRNHIWSENEAINKEIVMKQIIYFRRSGWTLNKRDKIIFTMNIKRQ
ncbi:hypothetical protein DRF65_20605 [Chryseobacterium pennae]|uniref:Uncharacterized protein n=1 Tax=Chryseobacterium pennae TaxID=2258962 RepID=A0A3D9C3M6_9FLAO|nr:hypothetical protein DRF65_20605 [Chryseobacterium pennae]